MKLNSHAIIERYRKEFMRLEAFGEFKEFLGVPFGVNLNSCHKDGEVLFNDFLLGTIKFSRFDNWHDKEVSEEVEYLAGCLNCNDKVSTLHDSSISSEISTMARTITEYDKSIELSIPGQHEALIYGYKFQFNWNHWSLVGESDNYFIAYHWYTCE